MPIMVPSAQQVTKQFMTRDMRPSTKRNAAALMKRNANPILKDESRWVRQLHILTDGCDHAVTKNS